jgi:hypothetical protein
MKLEEIDITKEHKKGVGMGVVDDLSRYAESAATKENEKSVFNENTHRVLG